MLFKRRTQHSKMSLEEAHELYLAHKGSMMSLCFDNSQKYNEFVNLRLKQKIFDSWNREILLASEQKILGEHCLEKWIAFGDYFDALERLEQNYQPYLERFYQLIDYLSNHLDNMQKILIMEHFGGRRSDFGDSIIKRITCKNVDKTRLVDCINRLMDFVPNVTTDIADWKKTQDRYLNAQEKILLAIKKYF